MDAPTSSPAESRVNRDLRHGLIVLTLALVPALAAIAWVPDFVTQDGPAHIYNARILNESLRANTPYSRTFEVAWQPLPNWAGLLSTMALVAVSPPLMAGRLMAAITLIGLAVSLVWLRWAVAGPKGLATASILAVVLALNVTWLLGFTSFLLGSALMPVTLALWWGGREWFGATRALGLSFLLVLGYFCHPISLGVTIIGLGLLAVLTPSLDRIRRALWTASSLLPLLPLGFVYRSMMQRASDFNPVWESLRNPWSPRDWVRQIGSIDPLSLASKIYRPFSEVDSRTNGVFSPVVWTALAIGLLAVVTLSRRPSDRRGWLVLAVLLMLVGLVAPDTLGVNHSHFLPQRLVLLGLIALVPWLDLSNARRAVQLASALLIISLGLQSVFVWDYALECRKTVGSFLKAGPVVGSNQRVGTLLVGIKSRFRASPMLHADCLLGALGDNVIWNNGETSRKDFPVQVRKGLAHPPAQEFELVSWLDPSTEADDRAGIWEAILDGYGPSIDRVVEWSTSPSSQLDAINRRQGYELVFQEGATRVWVRRSAESLSPRGSP